ncbi:MAG: SagB/ThcOx family dehydrogenase [Leptolyngbyaceae cyanobacterium MO_188.B28]|nr:SagB/ThcOx family dehydrogenase [Leptolyngbyaceae cyanobacterium MO_188.B28]
MDLTNPYLDGDTSLEKAISKRRTIRNFTTNAISSEELSQLIWAAQGMTGANGERTTPSAGAVYPLTLYVVVGNVSGVSTGLYRYKSKEHKIAKVSNEDLRAQLYKFAIDDQPWILEAATIFVVVSDFALIRSHFQSQPPVGLRGYRYAYIETGALAENVSLQAVSLNLGVVLVGGFDDQAISQTMDLPTDLGPTAMLCIGKI